MGVDMELEFDKFCKVGRSPRTVLPAIHHPSKVENRNRKVKSSSKKDARDPLKLEEQHFADLKFRNYRSVSCKNLPSGGVELDHNEDLRRGSVYQSSRERKFIPETRGGRKKIEFSRGGETSFSFSILDSICGSDEELEDRSSKLLSGKPPRQPYSVDFRDRQSVTEVNAERDPMENQKFKCQEVSGPSNNANALKERDSLALNKSLSAKLAMPHSPTHSEGNSSKGSPKSRFTPIRKMFDPLTKSKSHRNPPPNAKSSGLTDIRVNTLRKSLLQDFSSAVPNLNKDEPQVVLPCLAAHLQGNLKMEQKHGVPYFEFSVAQTEDVFVAKTWKAEDALNWVYTFHCVQGRKKSNASGCGIKYSNKDSPMVGQMQVKCYLCSELRCGGGGGGGVGGAFSDSMMTEFVLYDIDHARKSVTSEEDISSLDSSKASGASPSSDILRQANVELDDLFSLAKPRLPLTSSVDRISTDFSSPYPLSPADLHPRLEIAAVVVQVPLEKRESLKYKRGERHTLDSCVTHEGRKGMHDDNKVKLNVVAPLGNHSLPNSDDSSGPSPLLDRWRLGGGCECGGWDMACPLIVFGNPKTHCSVESSLLKKGLPLKLYVQGGKDNVPALTITVTTRDEYVIDFHAQLSKLQAFAVCVAILHASEASSLFDREKSKELLQCSSVKILVEDEMKMLIEAVTEEEKKKVAKLVEGNAPTYVLNPPFSPIARV